MAAPHLDEYARSVMRAGQDLGISPRGIVIGFATVFVESAWLMYANEGDPDSLNYPHEAVSYDANSVGLFQQRAPWWGTVSQRMDPYQSALMYFTRLKSFNYEDTSNSPGWYAQQVQQSAFPDRYDEHIDEAQALFDRLTGAVQAQHLGPDYQEIDCMTGGGCSPRSRQPINFLLHTQEGDGSAVSLAQFCNGDNNVSYHYTLRDGVLCDVVDTDMASWSVLDANAYTINLCYAGSFAGWSRKQWLTREKDIAISAWIAVQDCEKYGISTEVITPPYGDARSGISDHKYVTQCLGIGTHVDVGGNYPWDVFAAYVRKFSTGQAEEGPFMALSDDEQREMLTLLRVLAGNKFQSRSPLRHLDEGAIETIAGFSLNEDANLHVLVVLELARAGVQSQIDLLKEIASADPVKYADRRPDIELAKVLLAELDAEQAGK